MNTDPALILDNAQAAQEIDRKNMLRLINELPEQFETALGIVRYLKIEEREQKPDRIYLTGSASSAAAVDLAAAVLCEETNLPVVTDHSPRIPASVGETTLAVVVDFYGTSKISLRNYRDAKARGAQMVCLAGGGPLIEAAAADGALMVRIPPGQPGRTAVGYLLVPILAVAERMMLTANISEKLAHAIKLMKNAREWLRIEYPSNRNIAKRLAAAMAGRLPVIFAAPGYRTAVARRWLNQINASAKTLVIADTLPDFSEIALPGWTPTDRQSPDAAPVLLRDRDDLDEIAGALDRIRDSLEPHNPIEVEMQGAATLEKTLYGIYLGDYVSYYLALLNGVDPTPTLDVSEPEDKPETAPAPEAEQPPELDSWMSVD